MWVSTWGMHKYILPQLCCTEYLPAFPSNLVSDLYLGIRKYFWIWLEVMKAPQTHLLPLKQAVSFPVSSCWGKTAISLSLAVPSWLSQYFMDPSQLLSLPLPPCCSVHHPKAAVQGPVPSSPTQSISSGGLLNLKKTGAFCNGDHPLSSFFAVASLSLACPWLGLEPPPSLLSSLALVGHLSQCAFW